MLRAAAFKTGNGLKLSNGKQKSNEEPIPVTDLFQSFVLHLRTNLNIIYFKN